MTPTLRTHAPATASLLLLVAVLLAALLAGCSVFGSETAAPAACAGVQHAYASPGISAASCADDPRGAWIEGQCYCHGTAD